MNKMKMVQHFWEMDYEKEMKVWQWVVEKFGILSTKENQCMTTMVTVGLLSVSIYAQSSYLLMNSKISRPFKYWVISF